MRLYWQRADAMRVRIVVRSAASGTLLHGDPVRDGEATGGKSRSGLFGSFRRVTLRGEHRARGSRRGLHDQAVGTRSIPSDSARWE